MATTMERKLHGIASFLTWSGNGPSHLGLANNGFYYSGFGDKVTCYKCKVEFDNSTLNDDVIEKHKRQSPGCQLANGNQEDINSLRKAYLGNAGMAVNKTTQSRKQIPQLKSESAQALVAEQSHLSANSICNVSPKYSEYSNLLRRIDSFKGGIISAGQTAEGFAEAGFFHIGPGDKVMCFHCGGNLKDWEPNDDPWDQHKMWYPKCPHLRTKSIVSESAANGSLTPQQSRLSGHSIPHESPKYSEYSNLSRRIDSFKQGFVSPGQTAQSLAKAGFFHIGPGDRVMCFQCGGNLMDWEPKDVPWEQHKIWHPKCPYLRTRRVASELPVHEPYRPTFKQASAAVDSFPTEPRDVKARMDTAKRRAILDMGFDKEKAIEIRLTNKEIPDFVHENRRLKEENRRLREANSCKVCMDAEVETVFLPCGHLVCCNKCSPLMRNCPICRTLIRGTVKTFLA